MRACIRRGADQVGGSLVELEADGRRLVLDAGLPLEPVAQRNLLPDVPGLWASGDGTLLGLLISHSHPDHFGLADLVATDVPIFIGERATAILEEAAFFVPSMRPFPVAGHLRHRDAVRLGPFTVTPWLVDHSAFDAYALLVDDGKSRLLYTGDVRAHGRKPDTLDELGDGAGRVDTLLIEGTRMGTQSGGGPSESDVEEACVELFRAAQGIVLAFYSGQNVDRLVTLYRAAKRAGRTFVMDLYTAAIAGATGRRTTIPQAEWEGVRVYLPASQRRRVMDAGAYERTDAVRADRIYPEELKERSGDLVITCRHGMLRELEAADCLEGGVAVWSQWAGYLDRPSGMRTAADLRRLGIPLEIHHASGHATRHDLVRLARGIGAGQVVPIHTGAPDAFTRDLEHVVIHPDGEWWDTQRGE